MTGRAVAKRYARALLALAKETDDPRAIGDALEQVATALKAPAVAAVVTSPAIGSQARLALVRQIIDAARVPRLLANCLFLLGERRRLDVVDDLWHAYVDLLDQTLGRRRVILRSATPLADEQVQRLLECLRGVVGKGEVVPVLEVDPDLLGGVVAEIGGVVYDASVKTHVGKLARQMAAREDHPGA